MTNRPYTVALGAESLLSLLNFHSCVVYVRNLCYQNKGKTRVSHYLELACAGGCPTDIRQDKALTQKFTGTMNCSHFWLIPKM